MAFDWTWLTDTSPATEPHRETVEVMRRFLTEPDFAPLVARVAASSEDALRALAEVLVERRDGTRLAHLREAPALPKAARKEIGKAVHRLKTVGVACEVGGAVVGTLAIVQEMLPSYMALPLANGIRLLLLTDRVGGALQTAYVISHETDGVDDVAAIREPSRTKLRRLIEDVERGASEEGLFFVEAEPALVRTRIREAVAVQRARGKPLPQDWAEVQALVNAGPGIDAHPVHALVPSPDPGLLERGAELLGVTDLVTGKYRPGIADRPLPSDAFENELMKRLHDAWDSPLVVSDAQRRERLTSEVDRMLEDFFAGGVRQSTAARLRDTAYVLARGGRVDEAATVLVTADAVADSSRPLADIPWARESLRTLVDLDAFTRHMEQAGPGHTHDHAHAHGSGDPGGSLIV